MQSTTTVLRSATAEFGRYYKEAIENGSITVNGEKVAVAPDVF